MSVPFERSGKRIRWADRLLAVSLLLFLFAGTNRLRTAWESSGERFLIIHADDAGLCASANRATIDALQRGAVTSASIMVPCPGFEEFARFAASHPELDFGVHLTLTSEWDGVRWGPVSDPDDVPSLIDEEGTFWRSAAQFAKHADLNDVEREVRAQILRAQESGVVLSHLDNHMNSLFRRPDLMELLVRVSIDEGLPLRFSKRLPAGWEDALPQNVVDEYFAQQKVLYEHRLPLTDRIEADNYQAPPANKRAFLLEVLRNLDPAVTELVVHCCDGDGNDWRPPDASGRHAETVTLLSPEFADEIRTLGIRLIDWKDVRRISDSDGFSEPEA